METRHSTRLGILQILRLFASAMIILYHTDQIGSHGSFGVQIFFVISGFLAYYTTAAPVSPGRYLLRRSIRLLPLYWIFTVLTFVVLSVKPGISNMSDENPLHFLFSMLFIPYIGKSGAVLPILAVGWTMYYEVAFTVIFALSLLISHRHRFLVCSLLLLGLTVVGLLTKPSHVFFQFYTKPWYFDFFLGLLAAVIHTQIRRSDQSEARSSPGDLSAPHGRIARLGLTAAALASLACLFAGYPAFRIHEAIRVGIPAFILVLSLLLLFDRIAFPPKLLLGNMTYSVYLVEYFTTSVYKRIIPEAISVPLKIVSLMLLIAVTFSLSGIPYSLIEVKLSAFLKRKLCPPRQ